MDTILGYLESMFATLPDTPELLRAKRELGQMMDVNVSHADVSTNMGNLSATMEIGRASCRERV